MSAYHVALQSYIGQEKVKVRHAHTSLSCILQMRLKTGFLSL
jgi:hypothetical protein